jgi:hypothetical protein
LTSADAPLIDAEKLFRQPGPPHNSSTITKAINAGSSLLDGMDMVIAICSKDRAPFPSDGPAATAAGSQR